MSALKIIQALGRKIAAKKTKTPEGITQIQPQIYAESEAGSIAQRLINAGLPMDRFDDFIKSEADLISILNQIEAFEKKNLANNIRSGIRNTETGKVLDMKGKEIKNTDNIMGGEELPPPGSRGGPDDIAAPVQSSEETIKNMIEAENKKNISKIRNRKMVDDAIDNVSPGFVKGDRKYNAQLVAEELAEKKFGKEFYDLDQRQQMDLYDEALDGLSVNPDKFAQGGRAGFANGSKGLLDLLDIQASGSKSGKQQIDKAPEGFTIDSETYNFIVNADIPINEKINLLTKYGRDKGRDKIEKDGQELFLGEGGCRIREIGVDSNRRTE